MTDDQFCTLPNGLQLCYRVDGDPDDRPMLLIAGLGQQLIAWPKELVVQLVNHGFYVVRFDNRDAGRSSRVAARPPGRIRQLVRRFRDDQYTLADLADDTVALLDHLSIDSAHLVGMSMGGMIAQTIAALHRHRALTLTSIFSTTGQFTVGRTAVSTILRIAKPPPIDRSAAAEQMVQLMHHIGSRGFDVPDSDVREHALQAWDRSDGATAHHGVARQIGAIYRSGDRTADLRRIVAPTLVIHGDRDPMVHPSGGTATAAAIPDARLVTIAGMGHDLPRGAWPQLINHIVGHINSHV